MVGAVCLLVYVISSSKLTLHNYEVPLDHATLTLGKSGLTKGCEYNWCLWKFNGQWRGSMRHARRWKHISNQDLILEGPIDLNFQDHSLGWLGKPTLRKAHNHEDMRAIDLGGGKALFYGTLLLNRKKARVCAQIVDYDPKTDSFPLTLPMKHFESPAKLPKDKNWGACLKDGKIFFVHSLSPLKVYEWTDQKRMKLDLRHQSLNNLETILGKSPRNNSSLVQDRDGTWVGVGHLVEFDLFQRRFYYHFLYWLDKDLSRVLFTTAPFRFKTSSKHVRFGRMSTVQFAMGIVSRQNEYLVSYGEGDYSAHLAVIPRSSIEKLVVK